jgi:putative transposase
VTCNTAPRLTAVLKSGCDREDTMAHTYNANFVHCVFSTKDRKDLIPPELQEPLWAYFLGIANNLKIKTLAVGGTSNHVHLLLGLPPTMRLAEAIQKLKANSSRWLGEQGIKFQWQAGYGAFSVSPSLVGAVQAYIRNQEEHHRRRSFEGEFRALLDKCGVAYDAEGLFVA